MNEPQLIGQSPRILVVDDNDDNSYTLSLYLELEGYSNLESGGRREGNRSRRSAGRGLYAPGQLSLTPGDGIYVFTDGVTEANNATEEMFGETRLEAVLRGCGDCRSADIIKSGRGSSSGLRRDRCSL